MLEASFSIFSISTFNDTFDGIKSSLASLTEYGECSESLR